MPFSPSFLILLFLLGVCAGSLANLGIYRLAWHPRRIGPWSRPDEKAPPRRWHDRLPITGWLGLRREAGLHGAGFWVRPMLLELLCGIAFAALYWWEIGQSGLLPPNVPRPLPADWIAVLHYQFAAHLILIALMLVASMIDVDEKTIPDSITVPGTLLGLLIACLLPSSLLPDVIPQQGGVALRFLHVTSPHPWPPQLAGFPRAGSLAIGLGCWWLWCAALLPRTWYARHGWRRALQLCAARVARHPATYGILAMCLVGTPGIAAVWFFNGDGWIGLLSGLVGMAAGGGLVWMVRIIGSAALKKEAMGFGDVTLMAMIGAFLGWQTCLVVFFIAPLAGLVVGLVQLVLLRDNEIPYGPFLCLAAVVAIVFWAAIWERIWPILSLGDGWFAPLIVLACLGLMGVMLGLWRQLVVRLGARR